MSGDKLLVHTADGVMEVRLTGEPKYDALLTRFAQRGGTVTTEDGVIVTRLVSNDPDDVARQAMQEGA